MLDSRGGGAMEQGGDNSFGQSQPQRSQQGAPQPAPQSAPQSAPSQAAPSNFDNFDDDIPF
jgi:single-stranded DNA-binding protein